MGHPLGPPAPITKENGSLNGDPRVLRSLLYGEEPGRHKEAGQAAAAPTPHVPRGPLKTLRRREKPCTR